MREGGEHKSGTFLSIVPSFHSSLSFHAPISYLKRLGTITEVEYGADALWRETRRIRRVLCDRKISLKLQSEIYRTVIRPVALMERSADRLHSDMSSRPYSGNENNLLDPEDHGDAAVVGPWLIIFDYRGGESEEGLL